MSAADAARSGPSGTLDRRTFIGALAALLAGVTPLTAGPLSTGGEPSRLVGLLTDPAAAGRLGQHYLATHPGERDPARLSDALFRALGATDGITGSPDSPSRLAAALTRLILSEYRSGRLQQVDGWLLAPSEARLYALAAVLRPDATASARPLPHAPSRPA